MRANLREMLNAAVAALSMLPAAAALSQPGPAAYPVRPLRIVVPFAAGGPADITTRTVAPRMAELLGQSIVVDNRAGATGIIGAEIVAKSPPDGYTLLMATASVAAINMVTYSKLPYNTLRDLQPLTPIMTTATMLVVHPSLPAKNLKELVELARTRPGEISMGSAGTAGTLHLCLEMLMKSANVKMTHVPYKGAAPAITDVVGGQLSGMFVDLPIVASYVKAGRIRPIAMATPKRSPYFPDVPTALEAGFPNVEMLNYYALLTTAKTPADVVNKLHGAAVKTVNTPAVHEKLVSAGADPLTMTPDEFTRFLRSDIEKWDKVVKATGVKIEP